MPLITVRESFDMPLPVLQTDRVNGDYRTISASSTSTAEVEPPLAYSQEDVAGLLENITSKTLPGVLRDENGSNKYFPAIVKSHRLTTEADVVRAIHLYLLHSIEVAIEPSIPAGYKLLCRSEVSGVGLRTDIRWTMQRNSDGALRDVAVLEVKNTRVIRLADFSPAKVTPENKSDIVMFARDRPTHTALQNNAIALSKQAKHYSERLNVQHIALFDWNSMFIFDFSDMNDSAQNPTLARGLFFAEEKMSPNNFKRINFRRLLFAFLIRAIRQKGFKIKLS